MLRPKTDVDYTARPMDFQGAVEKVQCLCAVIVWHGGEFSVDPRLRKPVGSQPERHHWTQVEGLAAAMSGDPLRYES